MGMWNFFPVPPNGGTGPANPFTGFVPGMTGSFAPGYNAPSQTQPTVKQEPVPSFGEPSPTGGNTEPGGGVNSFAPQPNNGIFKFGAENSFKPIQPVQPVQQQGPRYRINEAMMRSPYYNPYFSSFQ